MWQVNPIGVSQKDLAHLGAVSQVGDAAGDGAGPDCDHLLRTLDGPAQPVQILFGAHAPGDQEHFDLRHMVGRHNKRHIGQVELFHPLLGVQKRHLATGAARELQYSKPFHMPPPSFYAPFSLNPLRMFFSGILLREAPPILPLFLQEG